MEQAKDPIQRKIVSFGVLLLIFFSSMGLVFYRLIKDNDDLVRITFVQVIALVLFMVWVTARQGIKFRKNPLNLAVILYVVSNALPLLITSNLYESSIALFKIIIYALIFFLAVNNLNEKDVSRSFFMIVVMGFSMALIGLLQSMGMDWFRFLYPSSPASRVFSILGNPDFLGGYLALILPLALILFVSHGLKGKGLFGAISFFVILLCLFLTATRSALIAFAGSFIFLSIIILLQKGIKTFKKRWAVLFVTALAVFSIMGFSGQGRIKNLFFRFSNLMKPETLKMDGAAQYRLDTWRTSILMFKEHPLLGVGTGVFKLQYPLYQAKLRDLFPGTKFYGSQESRVHNEYLQVLSETGIIGIIVFIGFFVIVFYSGAKYLNKVKEVKQKGIIIGLLSAIAVILLDSIFAFPFHLTSHSVLLWIFIAMIVVLGESHNGESTAGKAGMPAGPEKRQVKKIRSQRPWEHIIGIWAVCILLIVFIIRSFLGTYYYKRAILLGNQGMDSQVAENYLKAIKYSVNEPEPHFTWGVICLNNKEIDIAFEEFRKVEKLYPYNEDNLLNLGVVYNYKNMSEKSIEYFKKAIDLNPGIASAYFNIAAIYLNYNSKSPWAMEEALKYGIKAVELSPGDEYYKIVLKRIEQKQK